MAGEDRGGVPFPGGRLSCFARRPGGSAATDLEPGLPLVVAADIARFGSDETVIVVRAGNVVRIAKAYSGKDTMRTVGRDRPCRPRHGARARAQASGCCRGRGPRRRCRRPASRAARVPGRGVPRGGRVEVKGLPASPRRSWFEFAEKLPGLDIPADEELAADLLAPRYSLDSAGRRVVEAKGETKRRLRRSPDRGDAVVMAFAGGRQHRPGRTMSPFAGRGRHRVGAAPRLPAGRAGLSRDPFSGRWASDTVDRHRARRRTACRHERSSSTGAR